MKRKSIHRRSRVLALVCILSLVLAGCSSSQATVAPSSIIGPISTTGAYWPTAGWRTTTPGEQGMDSQKLAHMLGAIQQQHLSLHSLLVIRNGYVVSETYFGNYRQDTRHELYSCAKSFVSTLIGIAVDKA